MKLMRYVTALLLCLLLSLGCSFTAFAENIKYNMKDLKMTISVPDTMAVNTRENSTDLADSIYLEATSADSTLTISVAMIKNEKTQEIYSFENMPYSTLEEYKEQMLLNDGYIECKEGEYGGIPFLDFSQKYLSEAGVEIYGKQSVTLINGMSISITSQKIGTSFTSDELTLIKGCLDSIRFTTAKTSDDGVSFWGVFLWIILILLALAVAFFVFSYYMGKRSADKKREALREKRAKADYDVLQNAENTKRTQEALGKVGGYKSSTDYFEAGFDAADHSQKLSSSASSSASSATEKAVRSTKKAFTHVGYFFTNMKREIRKSKKAKSKKAVTKSRSAAKGRTKSRDYNVFSDK